VYPVLYDALDDWCGERFDVDVAARLANMPLRQADALLDACKGTVAPPPPVKAGELRPVLPSSGSLPHASMYRTRCNMTNRDRMVHLKALLFYAHSVTVVTDLFGVMRNLSDALMEIALLRPLSEAGAIHWMSPEYLDVYPRRGLGHEDWNLTGLPREFPPYNGRTLAWLVAEELDESLATADGGWGNVLFRYPLMRQLFDRDLGHLNGAAAETPNMRLLDIIRQLLPVAPDISIADLTAVRRHDERFWSWRTSLGDALRVIDNLPADTEYWQDEARALLTERLAPEAEALRRRLKTGGPLASAVTGVATFALSAVGVVTAGFLAAANPVPGWPVRPSAERSEAWHTTLRSNTRAGMTRPSSPIT